MFTKCKKCNDLIEITESSAIQKLQSENQALNEEILSMVKRRILLRKQKVGQIRAMHMNLRDEMRKIVRMTE